MAGLTLDAGPIIALERDARLLQVHFQWARSIRRTIPSVVVAQTWRGPRSARLAMLLRGCRCEPLDEELAKLAGELLARSGRSDAVDAIVVASAARRGDDVLTSDPGDLQHLADFAVRTVKIIGM